MMLKVLVLMVMMVMVLMLMVMMVMVMMLEWVRTAPMPAAAAVAVMAGSELLHRSVAAAGKFALHRLCAAQIVGAAGRRTLPATSRRLST